MKFFLNFLLLVGFSAHAEIEFINLKSADNADIQTCARYPDPAKFPGRRPVLMFIQGSGLYDTCLRLERVWGDEIVQRGVIVFSRQKRGIQVDPETRNVNIDYDLYVKNTIPSLMEDSNLAFESLLHNSRVDLNRIAIAGGSEGVWMATSIGNRHPEIREISLISSGIERFDVLFDRQLSVLIPEGLVSALDQDHSGALSISELSDATLSSKGLLSFSEIDKNQDDQMDKEELAAELRRAVNHALATGNNTFLLSDFGGGVSVPWLKSAYQLAPFAPEILKLKMPVIIHHGTADINASVRPIYELQKEAGLQGKTNFQFMYYDGLGHELSKDVLYKILFDLADRLNQ